MLRTNPIEWLENPCGCGMRPNPTLVSFTKVPGHLYAYKSSDGTKYIDRDDRGWKLYTPTLGKWTYYPTFEAAVAAAHRS